LNLHRILYVFSLSTISACAEAPEDHGTMGFRVAFGPSDTLRVSGTAQFAATPSTAGYVTLIRLGDSLVLNLYHLPSTDAALHTGTYVYTASPPPAFIASSRHVRLGNFFPSGQATVTQASDSSLIGTFAFTAVVIVGTQVDTVPVVGDFRAVRCRADDHPAGCTVWE